MLPSPIPKPKPKPNPNHMYPNQVLVQPLLPAASVDTGNWLTGRVASVGASAQESRVVVIGEWISLEIEAFRLTSLQNGHGMATAWP